MTDLSLFYADLYYVLPVFTVDTVVFWQQSLSLGIHWFARTWSVATKSVQCPRVTCHYPFTWRRSTKHATYRPDTVNIYIYLKAGLHGYQVFRVDSMSLSSSIELARTGWARTGWLGQAMTTVLADLPECIVTRGELAPCSSMKWKGCTYTGCVR